MNYNLMSPEEIMDRVIAVEQTLSQRAELFDKLDETIATLQKILKEIEVKDE